MRPGELEVVGLMSDERIKPGETVLTAGGDLIFPRGLPVGTVKKVVPDPDRDSFIDVMVTPAAHLDRLDEVLVITSTEPRFPDQDKKDLATSEQLDGAQAAAIQAQLQEQIKASEILAERLPGLTDPNAPVQPVADCGANRDWAERGKLDCAAARAQAAAHPAPGSLLARRGRRRRLGSRL